MGLPHRLRAGATDHNVEHLFQSERISVLPFSFGCTAEGVCVPYISCSGTKSDQGTGIEWCSKLQAPEIVPLEIQGPIPQQYARCRKVQCVSEILLVLFDMCMCLTSH